MKAYICERCGFTTEDESKIKQMGKMWGEEYYEKEICIKCLEGGSKIVDTLLKLHNERQETALKEYMEEKHNK